MHIHAGSQIILSWLLSLTRMYSPFDLIKSVAFASKHYPYLQLLFQALYRPNLCLLTHHASFAFAVFFFLFRIFFSLSQFCTAVDRVTYPCLL